MANAGNLDIQMLLPNDGQRGTEGVCDKLRACLESKKFCAVLVTSNLAAHAWSTKCRRKKKLITQLGEKSRDKTFKPN